MEDVAQLKNVLDRIEAKLIAASKIYIALQFQLWIVIMALYYVLISMMSYVPWQFVAAYWSVGFILFMYGSSLIWKRLANLVSSAGRKMKSGALGMGIGASWGIGALIGWFLVPYLLTPIYPSIATGIGYLVFIGTSVLGMFLAQMHFTSRADKEMIPAFLIPYLGIAGIGVANMHPMVYGGFVVAFGFSATVVLYLYSAFRTLG